MIQPARRDNYAPASPLSMKAFLLSAVLLAAVAGCDTTGQTVPGDVVVGQTQQHARGIGEIDDARVDINGASVSGDARSLNGRTLHEGPVSVQVGQNVDVTVYTFAIPCMSPQPSRIDRAGQAVTISVFDFNPKGVCTVPLVHLPRTETIRFDETGRHEVIVRGATHMWLLPGEETPHELRFAVDVML